MTVWSTSHFSAWSEFTFILICMLYFHPTLKMTVLFVARRLQVTSACILIASSNINCHHQTLLCSHGVLSFVSPTPVAEDITDFCLTHRLTRKSSPSWISPLFSPFLLPFDDMPLLSLTKPTTIVTPAESPASFYPSPTIPSAWQQLRLRSQQTWSQPRPLLS